MLQFKGPCQKGKRAHQHKIFSVRDERRDPTQCRQLQEECPSRTTPRRLFHGSSPRSSPLLPPTLCPPKRRLPSSGRTSMTSTQPPESRQTDTSATWRLSVQDTAQLIRQDDVKYRRIAPLKLPQLRPVSLRRVSLPVALPTRTVHI